MPVHREVCTRECQKHIGTFVLPESGIPCMLYGRRMSVSCSHYRINSLSKITVNAVSVIIIMLPAIIIVFFWLEIYPPAAVLPPLR
jgi:hypothetical protein